MAISETDARIVQCVDTIISGVSRLAHDVIRAKSSDDRIDWGESISLGMQAAGLVGIIKNAVDELNDHELQAVMRALSGQIR